MADTRTDADIIVALGRAERACFVDGGPESAYNVAIADATARFGADGVDRLAEHWTAMRADAEDIAAAEIANPDKYVRIARGE